MLLFLEMSADTQVRDKLMLMIVKAIVLLMADLGPASSQLKRMLTSGPEFVDQHLFLKAMVHLVLQMQKPPIYDEINSIYAKYKAREVEQEQAAQMIANLAENPKFQDKESKEQIKSAFDYFTSSITMGSDPNIRTNKHRKSLDGDDDSEEFEPVLGIDAPNSVIEAMIKAEMHKVRKLNLCGGRSERI